MAIFGRLRKFISNCRGKISTEKLTLQELRPPLRLPVIVTIDHEVRESGWQLCCDA
jgi:hypothetical protein